MLFPHSVAFVVSNPERKRSNDTDYPYRQSSDVLYLSNFPEPQSILILSNLDKKAEFRMIVRPRDKQREIWTGRRFGVEGAKENFLLTKYLRLINFLKWLNICCPRQIMSIINSTNMMNSISSLNLFGKNHLVLYIIRKALPTSCAWSKVRKNWQLMRSAAKISSAAHCLAMQVCRPGMMEYEIQAELERVFKIKGASGPAYNSIVAGGSNAVILHYVENNSMLKAGELLLIDAACEFNGYASDITRTFPISGKFNQAQKDIYNLVLDAQLAAIAIAKPGVTLLKLHETASSVLRKGLIKLGILSPAMVSLSAEEKILNKQSKNNHKSTPVVLRDLFMHGTSHWLGLDVHDVGTSGTRSTHAKKIAMKPGMVFTVEPGLYFDPEDKRLPQKYRGIGVRIEDDVVITTNGCEVLTDAAPKAIKDIEALMSSKIRTKS